MSEALSSRTSSGGPTANPMTSSPSRVSAISWASPSSAEIVVVKVRVLTTGFKVTVSLFTASTELEMSSSIGRPEGFNAQDYLKQHCRPG